MSKETRNKKHDLKAINYEPISMIKSFYLNRIVYYFAGLAAIVFFVSYFFPALYTIGVLVLILTTVALFIDGLILFSKIKAIFAHREAADRFSIGDQNRVLLHIKNNFPFNVLISIIDELPVQFQERNWLKKIFVQRNESYILEYFLRPASRGEYVFGSINLYVDGPLRLAKRRIIISAGQTVKVYPSFMQMRRYHLLAVSNKLQEAGVKAIRKIGHSMEFEHIKEYVRGDDYRTINWKASGRKGDLMVNNYTDERSQQIYCLINKGRVMKMPFEEMTLLDHAINASLVLSNVALVKQDKAGLITFAENIDTFIQADKKSPQMGHLLEALYKQQTRYLEADFEKLFSVIRHRITNRSLLVLFTNFESLESLQRELPALKKMARYHLLLVVFFENTALQGMLIKKAKTLEDIYIKTIAEKFVFEKKLMVKELQTYGIASILTAPQNLTVNTINKYMELKRRMSI